MPFSLSDLYKAKILRPLEIPQFFIVETQFVENNKLPTKTLHAEASEFSNTFYAGNIELLEATSPAKDWSSTTTHGKEIAMRISSYNQEGSVNSSAVNTNDKDIVVLSDDENETQTFHNRNQDKLSTSSHSVKLKEQNTVNHVKNLEIGSRKQVITRNCEIQASVPQCERSTSTLPPWPTRPRAVQHEMTTSDKSVQCDILKPNFVNNDSKEPSHHNIETNIEPQDSKSFKTYSNGMFECLICGETEENIVHIKSHVDQHSEISHSCFNCGKVFRHQFTLQAHENSFKCIFINNTEENTTKENTRKNTRNKFKLNYCPYPLCGHINYTLVGAYDHINHHLKEKLHVCSCGKKFISYEIYNLHRKIKKCKRNSYKFPYSIKSKNRKYDKLTSKIYTSRGIMFKKKTFRSFKNLCKYCYRICRNSFELLNHIRKIHMKKLECLLCKQVIDPKEFDMHIKDHKNPFFAVEDNKDNIVKIHEIL